MRRSLIGFLCLLVVVTTGYFVWQIRALESRRIAAPAVSAHGARPSSVDTANGVSETAAPPLSAPLPNKANPLMKAEPLYASSERGSAAAMPEDIVLRVHRAKAPETPAALQAARAALAQGDLAEAKVRFSALLDTDPHHLEALLGLADIALRQDMGASARQFYQAASNAYPQDIRAQAGLLGLAAAAGKMDAPALESRLKTLMAEAPQAATPHFVLGNLLAAKGRWQEAQEAYFEACRRDRENPDFRYNLAVSLDVLNQPKLAAEQYRAALAATAAGAPANFAATAVEARLLVLQALPQESSP
ncbi:MAG: tetratricopeptide repeat protein [Zoogloeaceae bacterium]|nr:tetratricopeptide repeat protein [Zoogloeaceae bacterium]